jgi:hypothetical protein
MLHVQWQHLLRLVHFLIELLHPVETRSKFELGDDLSMLIATSTVLHRVFTFDKSLKAAVYFGLVLTALMTGFITWHCIMDETLMHPILFGS